MKNLLKICLAIIVLGLASCERDELTLPAEVNFEFSMEPYQTDVTLKSMNSFNVNEGIIEINSMEFDGRRNEGEDYYFTKRFDESLHAELHTGLKNQEVSFDIPQGVYNRIDLNLSIGTDGDNAIRLQGTFQQGPFDDIPVVFEYSFTENVRIRAKNKEGNEQIVLKKDTPATATVVLDVPFLFQLVNMGMIQFAETT
ncbi:MAG: hypothetical protein ACQERU_04965, partial [Bacteroidota bacterium]